jgi:hypothetical protein
LCPFLRDGIKILVAGVIALIAVSGFTVSTPLVGVLRHHMDRPKSDRQTNPSYGESNAVEANKEINF